MNVIMLDIDGVLNSRAECVYNARKRKHFSYKIKRIAGKPYWKLYDKFLSNTKRRRFYLDFYFRFFTDHWDFCPIACSNLQFILDECPEVRIVISSTWRSKSDWALKEVFRRNGLDWSKVIGRTPGGVGLNAEGNKGNGRRGCQIQSWVTTWNNNNKDKIEKIAIIDDDSDMEHLKDRLYQTSGDDGLTMASSIKMIEYFKPCIEVIPPGFLTIDFDSIMLEKFKLLMYQKDALGEGKCTVTSGTNSQES